MNINDKYTKILFIFIHICFCMDFGYTKISNTKIKHAIKCFTLAQCLMINTIYYIDSMETIVHMLTPYQRLMVVVLAVFTSIQYLANSVILILNNRERSLYNLQKSLEKIDTKLSVDSRSYKVELKIFLPCVICVGYKAFLNLIFCINNTDECIMSSSGLSQFLFLPMLISFDVMLIMYCFVYYSAYCRLKVFNTFVYNSNGTQVLESLDIYKRIADIIEAVKKYFDILYILSLTFLMTDQIYTTYLGLLKLKHYGQEKRTLVYILRNIYSVHNFIVLISPAISAGLVTATVEELKLILLERILRERDTEHERHLQTFAKYVNVRPMRFRVLRVVPLDWSLPVLIINLCVSYQIIIVQFTQLY